MSGGNISTEGILPESWGYNALDLRHIKAIHRRFGTSRLSKYPTINFFQSYIYYRYLKPIRSVQLLNYIDYNKEKAISILQTEFGRRYYGGKHFESRFTKFFQAYYLPEKFGYDKRRAHLSSLIASGQMSRDTALKEMEKDIYPDGKLQEEREFIIKKLGLTEETFGEIRVSPCRTYQDYPSSERLFRLKDIVKGYIRRL